MAEKKISQLTADTSIDGTEIGPFSQGGTTRKVSIQQIVDFAADQIGTGGGGASAYTDLTDAATVNLPTVNTPLQTALALKAPLASPTFTGTVSGITKSMVGLSNVDNTADTSKSFSGAQITSGTIDGDRLPAMSSSKKGAVPATGTPSGKFLKDDNTWDTPAVSGGSGPYTEITGSTIDTAKGYKDLTADATMTVDSSLFDAIFYVFQDSTGGWDLTIEGESLPIDTDPDSCSCITMSFVKGAYRFAVETGVIPGSAVNLAPVASSVAFTGTAQQGQTLTGAYTYFDAESDPQGTSLKQWYRANDNSGTGRAAISGATNSTYVLQAGDVGKYIQYGVTPVATSGTTPGTEAVSSYSSIIIATGGNVAPVASSVAFTGTETEGQLLTGTYSYSDADSDAEGTSIIKWYRSDDNSGTNRAAISGATASTYTLVTADVGKFIQFAVTPVAATGTSPGIEVFSAYSGAIAAASGPMAVTWRNKVKMSELNSGIARDTAGSAFDDAAVSVQSFAVGDSVEFQSNAISGVVYVGLAPSSGAFAGVEAGMRITMTTAASVYKWENGGPGAGGIGSIGAYDPTLLTWKFKHVTGGNVEVYYKDPSTSGAFVLADTIAPPTPLSGTQYFGITTDVTIGEGINNVIKS